MNELLIGVFWSVYYVLHSALATSSAKRFFRRFFPQVYPHYRAMFITIAVVNFVLLIMLQLKLPSSLIFEPPIWFKLMAYPFFGTGLYILFKALRSYGSQFFFDVSGEGYTAQPLITHGLNGAVRHPLYFAILLLLIGLCCFAPNLKNIVFSLISTIYIIIGAKLEERRLIDLHGEAYKNYQSKVPMLIPYLF